jgi:hypothetical protein
MSRRQFDESFNQDTVIIGRLARERMASESLLARNSNVLVRRVRYSMCTLSWRAKCGAGPARLRRKFYAVEDMALAHSGYLPRQTEHAFEGHATALTSADPSVVQ